jgi:hypothetical protein
VTGCGKVEENTESARLGEIFGFAKLHCLRKAATSKITFRNQGTEDILLQGRLQAEGVQGQKAGSA